MTSKQQPNDSLITGQKPAGKDVRARELRRDMTRMERKLWFHLRGGRLDGLHFRRQLVADGFIVDFYCHEAGLVVEVDGGVHQSQTEYDAERDALIRQRNLHVLRITNAQVESACSDTLARIRQTARERLESKMPLVIPPNLPFRGDPSEAGKRGLREERSAIAGNHISPIPVLLIERTSLR